MAVADDDSLASPRVQDVLESFGREVLDRGVEIPAVLAADGLDDLAVPGALHRQTRPRNQCTLSEGEVLIGDHPVRIYLQPAADAGAIRAGAVRRVEAEAPRLQLIYGRAVIRAAVLLAIAAFLELRRFSVARHRSDQHDALAESQGSLYRVGQAGSVGTFRRGRAFGSCRAGALVVGVVAVAFGSAAVPDDESIHHHLNRVALVLVQWPGLRQIHLLAVDADASEPSAPDLVENAVTLGLAILYDRPQDHEPRSFRQLVDLIHDLTDRLALDLATADGAMRMADAGEEQAEVVVDLRHGADRRPWVPAGALLIDRYRRAQAIDLIDVRLVHLAEELAGIRGQTLNVAALAFGVDRVKG